MTFKHLFYSPDQERDDRGRWGSGGGGGKSGTGYGRTKSGKDISKAKVPNLPKMWDGNNELSSFPMDIGSRMEWLFNMGVNDIGSYAKKDWDKLPAKIQDQLLFGKPKY